MNFGLVLASFVLRLAAGMAVMVLMARVFGRSDFGMFVYWLAVATLVTVPVNYGLGTYVLRDMGLDRSRFHSVMGTALSAKLLIAAAVALPSLAAVLVLAPHSAALFAALLVAQLADSFGEFFNLGFRRDGHFRAEAQTAVHTALLHLLVLLPCILLVQTPLAAACAFAASRGVGAVWVWLRSTACTGRVRPQPLRQVPALLRAAAPYAGELALFTAYGQVDTLLINAVLGPAGVGLYQAGMKLVDGACRIAPTVAQYALPALAGHSLNAAAFRAAATKVLVLMVGVGAAGGLVLAVGAAPITQRLYGHQFDALQHLLPMFGLILMLKFSETAMGLLLVAQGQQQRKVWLVLLQLLVVMGTGYPALQQFGLVGWQCSVLAGLVVVLVLYLVALRHTARAAAAAQRA